MKTLKLFPWENGEKPYFVNDEGFEWYVDKDCTSWANKKTLNNLKPLNAICFFVVKNGKPLSRVLVDKNQNILHDDTTLDGMCCKIDFLRLVIS